MILRNKLEELIKKFPNKIIIKSINKSDSIFYEVFSS